MLDKNTTYYNECDIRHEGFREDLDFDHCVFVLSVLLVLGELYVCINFLVRRIRTCNVLYLNSMILALF